MSVFRFGVALVSVFILSGCFYDERIYSTYENMDAVKADGAIGRGWIPEWLPENAINIHEHHDLDTNVRAISFEVDQVEIWDWPLQCMPTETATPPKIRTKQFPRAPHKLDDIQNCVEVFAA